MLFFPNSIKYSILVLSIFKMPPNCFFDDLLRLFIFFLDIFVFFFDNCFWVLHFFEFEGSFELSVYLAFLFILSARLI